MTKRIKFFLSHLSISVLIALIVIWVVFFIWYPAPVAKAVGVTHLFLMMLVIDIIIGPMLSLLVYKEGKKSLKLDLAIIIVIQLSALCYGVYSIAQGRPVWVVYSIDRFELVKNNEIIDQNIQAAQSQYRNPSWLGPKFVAMQLSQRREQRNKEMFNEIFSGISLAHHPERYVPLPKVKVLIEQRTQNFELLQQFNDSQSVQKILEKYPQATGYVPLKANAVDMTVLINKEKGEVVKIVDLRPWK
ncbi:type IV pilin accessory protein [Acinetobacter beijerinckii]|uniref:TfpX/TfpZ family type IV pilin accessory protein n=1 Tax=Acinetobacter beijerinckii TaxID=262668 RepID=UPI0023DDD0D3|nr:TfpX/TfpZ family type IV pilin accessory protein [Acinetobacter beijerinckii]MDF2416089.1 type IV pilin accessory protein [Acinetobacter beijerinckii]